MINSISKKTQIEFFKYLGPSVIGCVSIGILIMIDGIFIGRGIGGFGLASLSTCVPAFSFYSSAGLLLGMGGATIASIQLGLGQKNLRNTTFTLSLILTLILGISLTILQQVFIDDLVRVLGATDALFNHVKDYLSILSMFTSLYIGAQFLNSFIRNDNNPKLAMFGMMAAGITNIAFDYLFIMVLDLGMRGAAFATGLSQVAFVAVHLLHFFSKKNTLKLNFKGITSKLTYKILKTGFPSFLNDLSNSMVIFATNLTLYRVAGETGVASYGVILNFSYIILLVYIGISQASQPLLSFNYGKKDIRGIKETIKLSLLISIIFSIFVLIVVNLFKFNIISMYNDEPVLVSAVAKGIPLFFSSTLFMGINILLASFFQAIGYSATSSIITFSRSIVFVIIGLVILPKFFGINGVWLTTLFAETITLLGFSIYFTINKIKL